MLYDVCRTFDDDGYAIPVPIFELWSLFARLDRIDAELNYLRSKVH